MWLATYVYQLDEPQRICLYSIWLYIIITDWFFFACECKWLTHFYASLFPHLVVCLHLYCFNGRLFLHVFAKFTKKHCKLLPLLLNPRFRAWYFHDTHMSLPADSGVVKQQFSPCYCANICADIFLSLIDSYALVFIILS